MRHRNKHEEALKERSFSKFLRSNCIRTKKRGVKFTGSFFFFFLISELSFRLQNTQDRLKASGRKWKRCFKVKASVQKTEKWGLHQDQKKRKRSNFLGLFYFLSTFLLQNNLEQNHLRRHVELRGIRIAWEAEPEEENKRISCSFSSPYSEQNRRQGESRKGSGGTSVQKRGLHQNQNKIERPRLLSIWTQKQGSDFKIAHPEPNKERMSLQIGFRYFFETTQ